MLLTWGPRCGLNGTRARRRSNKNTKMRLFPPHAAGPPTCRLRAREGPANPNQHPRPTWGVHGSGAHVWVMVQRPSKGMNGAKRTEMAVGLVSFSVNSFFGRR